MLLVPDIVVYLWIVAEASVLITSRTPPTATGKWFAMVTSAVLKAHFLVCTKLLASGFGSPEDGANVFHICAWLTYGRSMYSTSFHPGLFVLYIGTSILSVSDCVPITRSLSSCVACWS